MTDRLTPDWIDGFLAFTHNTEGPYTYRLWTAISVVASALQRKCKLEWGSLTFYPNMYIVLVGPSGDARKGTAMNPGLEFLYDLEIKTAAEAITREALIRELAKASDTIIDPSTGAMEFHSSLTVFSPELTVFLGYHNAQLMSDLTDWYDCRKRWTYRTKNVGTDEIIGVWVNIIGATTPDLIQAALPMDAIGGGLTSRIVFVYEQKKGKSVPYPFLTNDDLELRKKLWHDLERIKILQGSFRTSEDYLSNWIDWYTAQEGNPPFDDPRFGGYFARRPNHVMKLATIFSASRSDEMLVELRDLERAQKVLTQAEVKMPYTFSGVGKSSLADITDRVMVEIGLQGKMTFSELMVKFHRDADKWTMEKVLQTLDAMKFVDVLHTPGAEPIITKR